MTSLPPALGSSFVMRNNESHCSGLMYLDTSTGYLVHACMAARGPGFKRLRMHSVHFGPSESCCFYRSTACLVLEVVECYSSFMSNKF